MDSSLGISQFLGDLVPNSKRKTIPRLKSLPTTKYCMLRV